MLIVDEKPVVCPYITVIALQTLILHLESASESPSRHPIAASRSVIIDYLALVDALIPLTRATFFRWANG